jgi:predicted permease
LAALGIPLKLGRDFDEQDTSHSPQTVIVNEALVRESLPGQNPIGKTFYCLFDSPGPMTIIGVAGDVHERGPAQEPVPECYISYRQHVYNGNTLSFVARTAGDPAALQESFRQIAHQLAPDVPMRFSTLESDTREGVAGPRFSTTLFGAFAGLAVLLAMAGVYGVTAYAVGQRSNEIGLRMALGASSYSVLRLVIGQGLALTGLGLAVGLGAAIAGSRLLTSMLFQVRPNDPFVYVAVSILLGVVTLVASYVPARRACRIDPVTALRQE